jgi:hypothetical protein
MVEIDSKPLVEFMNGVKQGNIRGDVVQVQVSETITVELSVGPFEYGYIHLRIIIEDQEIPHKDNMYYRRLYKYGDQYSELHKEVSHIIEQENETEVRNAHEWTSKTPVNPDNHPSIPDNFNVNKTMFFDDYIQLRNDVTIEEALKTNRTDSTN